MRMNIDNINDDNDICYQLKGGFEMGLLRNLFFNKGNNVGEMESNNLSRGKINSEYLITDIESDDEETNKFLFSLGCYEGEVLTLISILGDTYVIKIKDGRYSVDKQLAKAIKVKAMANI